MSCPPEIADILLQILHQGILRIRGYASHSDLVFLEADHLHNLPELLRHFSFDLLRYYWEVERVSYREQCADRGIETTGYEPLWQILQVHVDQTASV